MHADDTSLAYASSRIDDIAKAMNTERENIRKWLHVNKLTLNFTKTTSMVMALTGNCMKATAGAYTGTFQNIRRSNRVENICKVPRSYFR